VNAPNRAFPHLGWIDPPFDRLAFGKAPPVRLPPETCRCCMLPATRRVWVRWEDRWTTHDAVAVCDDHAHPARTRFRRWLAEIRSADFQAERRKAIRQEDKDNRS